MANTTSGFLEMGSVQEMLREIEKLKVQLAVAMNRPEYEEATLAVALMAVDYEQDVGAYEEQAEGLTETWASLSRMERRKYTVRAERAIARMRVLSDTE